jgi:selenide,water dikinase
MESPGTRIRLTALSACAGCASKVGSADLAQAMRRLPAPVDPNVLVGFSTNDDAGVYRLTDDVALVQTVDFFTPIVDDPYDFGRIAAANALSDVYAMGGVPRTALNIAAFPIEELGPEILGDILAGGAAVAREAGVTILGGHTVKDAEPKYGLAVTGTIRPNAVVTNGGARPGDTLLLTKPVGTGVLTTARKRGRIDEAALAPAIAQMVRLNARAGAAMVTHGAHGATDVTGFGLVGHAGEMARASGVALAIDAGRVPLHPGVLTLIDEDCVPGGTRDNLAYHAGFARYDDGVSNAMRIALSDAQTSGGLLIAISADGADAVLRDLADLGTAAIIGEVLDGPPGAVLVR